MGRFTGLLGIALILGIAFLMSNNRKKINYRVVLSGLAIQLALAFFMLKVPVGKMIFGWIGWHLAGPQIGPVGRLAGGIFIYAVSVMDAYRMARFRWARYQAGRAS